jgi:hypothetical protein
VSQSFHTGWGHRVDQGEVWAQLACARLRRRQRWGWARSTLRHPGLAGATLVAQGRVAYLRRLEIAVELLLARRRVEVVEPVAILGQSARASPRDGAVVGFR